MSFYINERSANNRSDDALISRANISSQSVASIIEMTKSAKKGTPSPFSMASVLDLRESLGVESSSPLSIMYRAEGAPHETRWTPNAEYSDLAHSAALGDTFLNSRTDLGGLTRAITPDTPTKLVLIPMREIAGYTTDKISLSPSTPLSLAQACIDRILALGAMIDRSLRIADFKRGSELIQSGRYDTEELIRKLGVGRAFIEGSYNAEGYSGESGWAIYFNLRRGEVWFGYKWPGGPYRFVKFTGAPDLSVNTIDEMKGN